MLMAMAMNGLEIRHLRALRAVAEEGTFAAAGERLGYTQSAISQQIVALESLVGGPLFDRPGGPKRAVLTPLGERILRHGDDILRRVEVAGSDVARFLAGQVGTLSVGTFQSASVRLLPRILQRLRKERPQLDVQLSESTEERELLDWLVARKVDVTFLTSPIQSAGIEIVPLITDPFVLVSARDSGVDDLPGETVAPADLSGKPLVCETTSECQRLIEDGLRDKDAELNIVFRTQDNAAVQAMARSGVGHAVMASLAVDLDDPGVLVRALDPPIPPRLITLGLLADREPPPALDRFVELTSEVAAELVAGSKWLTHPDGSREPRA